MPSNSPQGSSSEKNVKSSSSSSKRKQPPPDLRIDTSRDTMRSHIDQPRQSTKDVEAAASTSYHRQRARYLAMATDYSYGEDNNEQQQQTTNNRKKKEWKMPGCWVVTTWVMTWWVPASLLSALGIKDKHLQYSWREKLTLVIIIVVLCTAVGYLTFGFNATVCGRQPSRIHPTGVNGNQIIISGRVYNLGKSYRHPTPYPGIPASGDLLEMGYGGRDLSFLFQTVNLNCKGIFRPLVPEGNILNYFPCAPLDLQKNTLMNVTSNSQQGCHPTTKARDTLRQLHVAGDVYYNWTDIRKPGTSLVAFNGNVLDLSRLRFLTPNVPLPFEIAQIVGPGSALIGRDATYWLSTTADRLQIAKCLTDLVKVGVLDERSAGCLISDIVLFVSLVVILGVVLVRFLLALVFGWFISRNLGSIRKETAEERRRRRDEILEWEMNNAEQMHYRHSRSVSSIAMPGNNEEGDRQQQQQASPVLDARTGSVASVPNSTNSTMRKLFFFAPTTSRFTLPNSPHRQRPQNHIHNSHGSAVLVDQQSSSSGQQQIPYTISSQFFHHHHGNLGNNNYSNHPDNSEKERALNRQIRKEYNWEFDPIYTFMVVTCYSEGEEGLRTTFDSLANTDYPPSHKLLIVICDGVIIGSGNTQSTPDLALSMMEDDLIPREQVKPVSYVAIADGIRRHNMAKVYAGYYKYKEDSDVPEEKRQKVPMIVITKCGTTHETRAGVKKPGNRGKRDSQVILMNTMQKVYYNERMCALEYQFCKAVVKLTGHHPSRYETCLMVDADTKVYPDSLARMTAAMRKDERIMGLCGETKIANKGDSWVTAIQVFEYYISHHMSKAFESIFGGVTCLPGCFCMYRIIAPKDKHKRYYVPIFCSTDIVEAYSENVVDTLHKKNLLLLGEDRYLTTLMLRTFPKRKMVFVPGAVCKTVVPDTFPVLLSQRRRWINSTVHNLLELVLIRDLCGTFCFSMQFVVFMELVGTVVLPAAICFTFYLVIISFFVRPPPLIPLGLLAAILGLPAVLISLTTRKLVYVGWMLVYLLSLPIWNFLLPAYAYWNFDDFSWGETRQVQGVVSGENEDHARKQGKFDGKDIVMRTFEDWARHERTTATTTIQYSLNHQ